MKVIISEKQLARIIGKSKFIDEEDKSTISSTPVSPSDATSSATSINKGASAGSEGKGQMDFPPYPEVDHADDLVKRGVANPVDYTKKHEDYPEANPVRGRANPIKGM